MSEAALHVESLGKAFRLAHRSEPRQAYRTLREDLHRALEWAGRFLRSQRAPREEIFWALKNVSFQVEQGEVLGIIGRNGAGKSTLLKILSRITEPTTGFADVFGRVGSLLEVGTGFHPELTGRENIYLNGAMLGMSRKEIRSKFDDIVAFAEVERFIDTPVKRYSSGMYVRLAFAVAAHLEPEILLVDEVLAVGDAEFQRKCLGKMGEVAAAGRTVLFVSHNMAAIAGLCQRLIWLDGGSIRWDGEVTAGVAAYLRSTRDGGAEAGSVSLAHHSGRRKRFDGLVRLTHCRLLDSTRQVTGTLTSGSEARLVIAYEMRQSLSGANVTFVVILHNSLHQRLAYLSSDSGGATWDRLPESGEVECLIPSLPLAPGSFSFSVLCKVSGGWADAVYGAISFEVAPTPSRGGELPWGSDAGVLIDHSWAPLASLGQTTPRPALRLTP
jgi:lipopolysaccharide transport system ATP-binding protein